MKLLLDFIFVSGMIINLLVLILLLRKGEKRLPDWLLVVIFSCMLLETVHFYGGLHELDVLTFLTFPLEDGITFILGPILLLYVKSLYLPAAGLVRRHWAHFLPFFLYLWLVSVPVMISFIQQRFLFDYLRFLVENEYIFVFHMLYLLVYTLVSLRLVRRYELVIKEYFSDISGAGFDWIRRFFQGILLLITIDLLTSFYELLYGEFSWDTGNVTVTWMIIMIAYLGYHGISQSRVLLPDFLVAGPQVQGKLESSAPTPPPAIPDAEPLAERLHQVLVLEEAYLDEELTLGKLAALLPTTDKKLSMLLNQHLGVSFYDLVNRHRVEAVQQMMAEDSFGRQPNIEIAYACGFKSKTSFNRVFKKLTGTTPGEYRGARKL